MQRRYRRLLASLLTAAVATTALATAALAGPPPPRRGSIPGGTSGAPAPRTQCAYMVQIADFRIVKIDQVPRIEPKGHNAPMRFDITLKNIGTGTYSPRFGHNLELALGARGTQPLGGGKVIRRARVRELQPGQEVRLHWNYDYNTRDAQLPSRESQFQAAIWNACNPSYAWSSRVYPKTIPVYQWALEAFRKYHRGEARRF